MGTLSNLYFREFDTRTTLTADLTIAASVAGVSVADSALLAVGMNVFASDGTDFGYFEVTAINSATSIDLDKISGSSDGSIIATGSDVIVTGAAGADGGGGSAIEVEDDGVSVTTNVTKFNFTGSGVTITEPVTDEITVDISGGAGNPYLVTTLSGTAPTLTDSNSIFLGENFTQNGFGDENIFIGRNITFNNFFQSVAVGVSLTNNADSATNIGSGNNVLGFGGTVVGNGSDADGADSIALGSSAIASGQSSVQLGTGTNPTDNTLQFQAAPIANSAGIIAQTFAGVPGTTPDDGELAVDTTGTSFYFGSGGTWNQVTGGGGGGTGDLIVAHEASITAQVNQNIPDAVPTTVLFQTEVTDTDNWVDLVTNNDRITVNEAGLYNVTALVRLDARTDYEWYQMGIDINGSGTNYRYRESPNSTNTSPFLYIYATLSLEAGDYISLSITQRTTPNAATNINNVATNAVFTAELVKSDGGGSGGGSPLTVQDGITSVSDVEDITFVNATVTDNGSGAITVTVQTAESGWDFSNLPQDTSLIHYWNMNEVSGDREDIVDTLTLTDNNTVTSDAGIEGNAAVFASANSEYLGDVPFTTPSGDFSISCWIYVTGGVGTFRTIIAKTNSSNDQQSFSLAVDNTEKVNLLTSSDGTVAGRVITTSTNTVSLNTWYHVVVTYDSVSDTQSVYLDAGTPDTGSQSAVFNSTENLTIGANNNSGSIGSFMEGRIDEVAFYDGVVLSAGEVSALYNSGSGLFPTFIQPPALTRELLDANRTYYVSTTGDDNNDGLTVGTPFLTIQKAIDVAASLDFGIYDVTIQLADGTYNITTVIEAKSLVGAGSLIIQGNNATPANVVLDSTTNSIFDGVSVSGVYDFRDFTIQTSSGNCFYFRQSKAAVVKFSNLRFGTCSGVHMAMENGTVFPMGSYEIFGDAAIHYYCIQQGYSTFTLAPSAITVTLTGTPDFSNTFMLCTRQGQVVFTTTSLSFVGTATGKRFTAESLALIDSNGAGTGYLPGDVAGTTATSGLYL